MSSLARRENTELTSKLDASPLYETLCGILCLKFGQFMMNPENRAH